MTSGHFRCWHFLLLLHCFTSGEPTCPSPFPASVSVNPRADFIIGVLLPLRNSSSDAAFFRCGSAVSEQYVRAYEALRWTMNLLNGDRPMTSGDPAMLGLDTEGAFIPGTTFGLRAFDSCGHDALAQQHLQELFPELKWTSDEDFRCMDNGSLTPRDNILGAIDFTGITDKPQIENRLRDLHIPTMTLDFETIVPAEERAKAMIQMSRKLGWQWAALVHGSDEYSVAGAEALRRMAEEVHMCLGLVESIPHLQNIGEKISDVYRNVITRIASEAPPNGGVFVFARGQSMTSLLDLILAWQISVHPTTSLQWFFSDTVRVEDIGHPLPFLWLHPLPAKINGFEAYWSSLSVGEEDQNRWFSEYTTSGRRLDNGSTVLPAIQAALTLTKALKSAWKTKCGGKTGLCRRLRQMSRAQFVQSYLEPLEQTSDKPILSSNIRLALSVQQGSDMRQVMVYGKDHIEVVDNDFRGIASVCPDADGCKTCSSTLSRIRSSRTEQSSDALKARTRLTFPLLLPLRGYEVTSGSVRCKDTVEESEKTILEEIKKDLQWAMTSDGIAVEAVVLDTCSSETKAAEALSRYLLAEDPSRRLPLAVVSGSPEEVSVVTYSLSSLDYAVLSVASKSLSASRSLIQMSPSPVLMAEALGKVVSGLSHRKAVLIRDSRSLSEWNFQMLDALRDGGLCIVREAVLKREDGNLSGNAKKLVSDLKSGGLDVVVLVSSSVSATLRSLQRAGGSGLTVFTAGDATTKEMKEFSGTLSSLIKLQPAVESDATSRLSRLAKIGSRAVVRGLQRVSSRNLSSAILQDAIRSADSGEPEFRFSEDNYGLLAIDVLQYSPDSSEHGFTKIGSYEDGNLTLLDPAATGVSSPSCSRVPPLLEDENLSYFPESDFRILLLLPIHDRGSVAFRCGSLGATIHLQEALAFGMSLESLQKDNFSSNPLLLGGIVIDHCQDANRASERIFRLMADGNPSGASVIAAIAPDDDIGEAAARTLSGTGIAVLQLNSMQFGSPIVRVGPSSPPHPSSSGYHVLRPDITAEERLTAVIDLLRHFRWSHVAVLTLGNDVLLRNFSRLAAVHEICVAGEFLVANGSLTDAEAMKLLQNVRRKSGARVVVVLNPVSEVLRSLLTAAEFTVTSEKLVFVLMDGHLTADLRDVTSHVLSLAIDHEDDGSFGQRWSTLSPLDDQWLKKKWMEDLRLRKFNCHASDCGGDERLMDGRLPFSAGYVQRATRAIALALVKTNELKCQKNFLSSLDNCTTERRARFHQELVRIWNEKIRGRLAILKYQSGSGGHVQKIGHWSSGHLNITSDISLPAFPCSGQCALECSSSTSFAFSTSSYAVSITSNFRSIWGLITSSLSGLGALLVIFCMVHFRDSSAICHLLLLGLLLLYILNFSFILLPGALVCRIRRFGLGASYALVFSAKLVRAVGVWRRAILLSSSSSSGLLLPDQKPHPSSCLQSLAVLLLTAVQMGLAGTWLVLSPSSASRSSCYEEEDLVVSMAYIMLLLALTLFFGILGCCRRLLLSTSLTAVVWVSWTVVVTHAPQPYRDPSVVLCNLMSASVVLVVLFAPRIFSRKTSCSSAPSSYSSVSVSEVGRPFSGPPGPLAAHSGGSRSSPNRTRSQVQATDLYPLDVYDTRAAQYSGNGRPKTTSSCHSKRKPDDYF